MDFSTKFKIPSVYCEWGDSVLLKRAALYLRVSNQDHIPDLQLHDLRQTATVRGYRIVGEYLDRISGAKGKRPALDQLLASARSRSLDVIIVASLSDLGGSVKACLSLLQQVNKLGIGFVSCRESLDTTDATLG